MASGWTEGFGLALLGRDVPTHAVAWARAAERAGFGSVWIVEDYYQPGAFALAGAVAAATERLAVGLGVVNPYTRHPALLAMEVAALAGLAPGRVVLGLGTSNRNWIEGEMRIPFKAPLQTLREGVEIVRRLLAGERLGHQGERFDLDNVRLEWTPAARGVPILLGVKGPKALRLAGEIADGVHGAVLTSARHVERIRATAGAARGAGRDRLVVVAYVPVAVGADGQAARQSVKPLLARYLGVLHGQSILRDAGYGPEQTEPFAEALRRRAPAADLVTDRMVDTLAVAGTPDECCAALRRLARAGLDAPIAVLPGGADVTGQVALMGDTLVPFWRSVGCR
ncbi:MAG: LLM class flavin-dependent oxidoreductase [Candidatus Rokubacteria bacterium]|nr:LLM class flavin-dependent oxidoreductase [Candidatus Rokubacteria bacterium]